MEWMHSYDGLAESNKFVIPTKTIGTITPDKSAVLFKVFVTDKDGMIDFLSGRNLAIKPIYDECIERV